MALLVHFELHLTCSKELKYCAVSLLVQCSFLPVNVVFVIKYIPHAYSQPNVFTICSFEFEADYIGLLLMASAGYDPRLAHKAYEEVEEFQDSMPVGSVSPYPTGRERVKALLRPKIMEEALSLYNDARTRRGIE